MCAYIQYDCMYDKFSAGNAGHATLYAFVCMVMVLASPFYKPSGMQYRAFTFDIVYFSSRLSS